jgi:glyoxylase I family protein
MLFLPKKSRALARESPYNSRMSFSLEHLGLPARDPIALKNWYVQVLKAQVVFNNGQTPPMFLLRLPGGIMIEIYAGDLAISETGNNKLNGWRHVALRVESIEAARAELQKRGVTISEEIKPAGGGGRVLFFADAEGNLLHLVERSVDSPVR